MLKTILGILFTDIPQTEEPLQILDIVSSENENGDFLHELTLNEENLSRIMEQDDVKDNAVMIVSIAGAFRNGKSFLLGFILKYLEAKVTTLKNYKELVKHGVNHFI